MTPKEFSELLKQNVLIIDGAMGTMIQNLGYDAAVYGGEDFQMLSDILVLSRPEAVEAIHFEYFKAGASAVETNTLCSSPMRLEEHDFTNIDISEFPDFSDGKTVKDLTLPELSYRLNRQAAQLADRARKKYQDDPEYDGRTLITLGSLGPSNWVLSSTLANLKRGTFDGVRKNFYYQALGLIDGGADAFLFETQQDMLELKAGILGARDALKEKGVELPIMAQVTVDPHARMQIFNTDILAVLVTLKDIGIDTFGINCGLGPDLMLTAVRRLSRFSDLPISIVPNAGLPESVAGKTVFSLSPEEMARHLKSYVFDYGVNIIGGCCGTTPHHIRALRQVIGSPKPVPRKVETGFYISGPQQAVKLDSSKSLIRIGERLNVRGSKKVREAVEQSDSINQEALEEVVSEQVRDLGLEIIDICMDSNIVDTKTALAEIIKAQTMDFPGAMSLDSFDVEALEEAIKVYPGRPIINSISLEEYAPGVDKVDAVLEKTKEHAPVYIALTTNPDGPALKAEKKIAIAREIVEKAGKKHGVRPDQIFIDINAFPIGSESDEEVNFALESLNAVPGIKKIHPDLKVIIGVGNLTNGLARKPYMRKVLTSVFLDEGRKKGLDAAIVNSNHYVPVDSLPEADYDLGKKVILGHDMDAFAELEEISIRKKGKAVKKKLNYDDLDPVTAICSKIKDGYKEREQGTITLDGIEYPYQDRIVSQVAAIIKEWTPLDLINSRLMPTMEELGGEFADGTVSLPHLLKSADVMKQVMGFLESYLKQTTGEDTSKSRREKGTVVLGTVYQDVHSIGKDLTKTLMENYGYRVIDLGVQVPVRDFIETARKNNATAIGMSALLVQTSNHMITVSSLLEEEKLDDIPLLVGGAPVNNRHAAFVALAGKEDESAIRGNVFYCRSGMDGVNYLNQLLDQTRHKELFEENRETLIKAYRSGQKVDKARAELLKTLPRREVGFEHDHTFQGELGRIEQVSFSVQDLLPHLNRQQLFSLNWRFGGKRSWEKRGISEDELNETLQYWAGEADKNGWIKPKAAYVVLPCRGGENTVTIFDPKTGTETARLTFNDVVGEGKKDVFNVARYFRSDRDDIIGLQISTGGMSSTKAIESLKADDREAAHMLQGLSDRVAEDLAEYVNRIMDRKVHEKEGVSSMRYSPGYPAMTEISNNRTIAALLEAPDRLDIELTDGFEFNPTGTTAAVVCFHAGAGYH